MAVQKLGGRWWIEALCCCDPVDCGADPGPRKHECVVATPGRVVPSCPPLCFRDCLPGPDLLLPPPPPPSLLQDRQALNTIRTLLDLLQPSLARMPGLAASGSRAIRAAGELMPMVPELLPGVQVRGWCALTLVPLVP